MVLFHAWLSVSLLYFWRSICLIILYSHSISCHKSLYMHSPFLNLLTEIFIVLPHQVHTHGSKMTCDKNVKNTFGFFFTLLSSTHHAWCSRGQQPNPTFGTAHVATESKFWVMHIPRFGGSSNVHILCTVIFHNISNMFLGKMRRKLIKCAKAACWGEACECCPP